MDRRGISRNKRVEFPEFISYGAAVEFRNQLTRVDIDVFDIADIAIIDFLVIIIVDLHHFIFGREGPAEPFDLFLAGRIERRLQCYIQRSCADAATGAIRWRGRVGGMFSASPIAVGGTIRNVSADGEVVTLADGDGFEVLGRAALGAECRATPAVVGGRMVFRTVDRLVAVDALTP